MSTRRGWLRPLRRVGSTRTIGASRCREWDSRAVPDLACCHTTDAKTSLQPFLCKNSLDAYAPPRTPQRPDVRHVVVVVELLDVDVSERHHAHVLDEPGGAIHVPHPRVGQGEVEVHVVPHVLDLKVHLVGEVEAPLGLDDVGEQPDDVAVLAVEGEFRLGLVVLQVVVAHGSIMPRASAPAHRRAA